MELSFNSVFSKLRSKINRRMITAFSCLALFSISLILSGASSCQRMVYVHLDGKTVQFYSAESTATEILKEHKISVGPRDDLEVNMQGKEIDITINRAIPVQILVDGEKIFETINPTWTVSQVIEAAGIQLSQEDVLDPPEAAKPQKDSLIQVKRGTHTEYQREEELPFETITKESSSLPAGETAIETAGKNGSVLKFYEDKYLDGEYWQTTETGSQVLTQPVTQVVLVGTAPKISAAGRGKSTLPLPAGFQLDSNGIPVNYSKVLTGRACAYSANPGAHTSTGKTVAPGYIAVNPNVIPYGTKMYIVSTDGYVYGYAIAADTGSSCMRNDILADLFMSTKEECCKFGSRTIQIYIL